MSQTLPKVCRSALEVPFPLWFLEIQVGIRSDFHFLPFRGCCPPSSHDPWFLHRKPSLERFSCIPSGFKLNYTAEAGIEHLPSCSHLLSSGVYRCASFTSLVLWGARDWTQTYVCVSQTLQCLSHAPSPSLQVWWSNLFWSYKLMWACLSALCLSFEYNLSW